MSYEQAVEYSHSLQKYGSSSGFPRPPTSPRPSATRTAGSVMCTSRARTAKGSGGGHGGVDPANLGLEGRFYSSPHLVRFTERFRINGKEIPPETAAGLVEELRRAMDPTHPPTFSKSPRPWVDLALREKRGSSPSWRSAWEGAGRDQRDPARGLGHHEHLLRSEVPGKHPQEIAGEKAGIIKKGTGAESVSQLPG
ncbi:MAG: hypothetical protein MZV70_11360 [Desulfobacterales bacterium]|nr:hypothetical protein [Desulfobacterales bacterium]